MEVVAKAFFEVLTELKVKEDLGNLFKQVEVEEVFLNQSERALTFRLCSKHLIHQKQVKKMEAQIKKQVFPTTPICIHLLMQYNLPKEMSLEGIIEDYKESLLFEIMEYSPSVYMIIKNAKWVVSSNTLQLTLEESLWARKKSQGVRQFLEEIFETRLRRSLNVQFEYCVGKGPSLIQENEVRLRKEVGNLMQNLPSKEQALKEEKIQEIPQAASKMQRRPAADPEVFYGRNCEGAITPISEIQDAIGEVVVKGKILALDTREIRNEKTIIIFDITDFTDTITAKCFVKNEELPDILEQLKKGSFYLVKGVALLDNFDKEISLGSIQGIKAIADFTTKRMDRSPIKRVELHLHTVMSDMDAVVDIHKVINRAKEWGMPALAITDHGCLQAFPIANHCVKKDEPFKVIYGVEGYFVDDLKQLVIASNNQSLQDTYVVFDLETTGFSPTHHQIIEIGAVKVIQGEIVDRFSAFVNPKRAIPYVIQELTGISDKMVQDALPIENVLPEFLDFCEGAVLVAHNADFDYSFIEVNAKKQGLCATYTVVDTVSLARILLPNLSNFKLNTVAKALEVSLENHHRAVDDATATGEIFVKFIEKLEAKGIQTLDELERLAKASPEAIKKMPSYHGIILVKNEVGRVNLNRLVSAAHLDYFNRRPRMPKSLIEKYREGLIIGSACEAGELFQALIKEKDEAELRRIVNFYDYLEIQPIGNNKFMLKTDKYPAETEEDLRDYNRRIVELGEKYHKPVVATCDVHFVDPEDEVYRRIMMAGKGFKDADEQAPLYLRTTDEMLEEFSYLGEAKAEEVVITNTLLINEQIEKISPVLPDKCPPEISDSDATLKKICYDKAHEIYGPDLPQVVVERLERELNSIISNGFAVMYIIAQKLVWDSNAHGYLVGSRGSVGSSFAATMAGITEVNPLAPHYICPACYYSDFDSEAVKAYAGRSGCDMPDAKCPKCGQDLLKEGHDIPFETFLGFEGDKEPDIDLNFSGDYQAKAHKYVEVIFGEGKAFRAGTIGTMAEKTALAYVYKYFEERNETKRRAEMRRLAEGCTGAKRTTGQHPGGIIVVPHDREIYEFTAIQHPANDMNTPIITTHFEYHSIDHNLLKLDILGHDDPTIIRRLEDITGINAKTIKLDDKDVMSLFHSTEALKINPKDIGGIPLGCLGIPEFGTDFVIQMLLDAKPQSFSDLVRISGLSHGTDVWLGNAQTLIEEGKGTISSVICTRDDIMTYLINQGMDKGLSFTIMESVRKGKGLKPEWEKAMLEKDVPDWYIWSCKKIKYMFPKAHAAAYVMMAWRIAWYKIFYPLAYYTAFFSIRASAFSYELMCQGKEHLEYHMKELMSKGKENQTAKEQDTLKDMRLVQEMYARGFEFAPIDLEKVDDKRFQIIDGKIMPSLSAIDGLGEKAAEAIVQTIKEGPFLSKDDFRARTKVSKTVTDKMSELGILSHLSESNQLDLLESFGF
ncbi:PolC-type DNA polymerase III [Sporanaerobium hydrogeniformans]|uniref:PolC-type DNA polymerase III n=1 Tax=Sporanaerobium hydrogeniformans TaxID=3072179 RepID=UPI0015D4F8D9|nr:PolC-type DNA polymerase III [Sporanaerobium hydrogeniformans]